MKPESSSQRDHGFGSNWASNPSTDPDQVRSEYDGGAAEYEQVVAKAEYRAPTDVSRLMSRYCGDFDRVVLDAGCGSGLSGAALAGQGFRRLVGIDLSPAMLNIAEQKAVYERLLVADLQQRLPFEDSSFGGAVCVAVLGHLPCVEQLAGELCRVVEPGGAIAFTQRDDLFQQWDYAGQLRRLEDAGLWRPAHVSEPQPYLPGRAEYGSSITVRYYVYTTA